MTDEAKVVASPVTLLKSDTKSSGDYVEFEIPEEIEHFELPGTVDLDPVEKLSAFTYGEDNHFFAKLVSPTDSTPGYAIIDFEEDDPSVKRNLKIRNKENPGKRKYLMTLPSKFYKDIETSPFFGIENQDEIIVEVSTLANEIRLYRPSDYMYRNVELVKSETPPEIKQPILLSWMAGRNGEEYVDLARPTPFEGTKFEIIPFDAEHRLWWEQGEEDTMLLEIQPARNFRDIISEFEVPVIQAERLKIYWDPLPEYYGYPDRKFELYSETRTDLCMVILPERGGFIFEIQTRHGNSSTWATYYDETVEEEMLRGKNIELNSREEWRLMYSDQYYSLTEPIQVFVPSTYEAEQKYRDGMKRRMTWHWD